MKITTVFDEKSNQLLQNICQTCSNLKFTRITNILIWSLWLNLDSNFQNHYCSDRYKFIRKICDLSFCKIVQIFLYFSRILGVMKCKEVAIKTPPEIMNALIFLVCILNRIRIWMRICLISTTSNQRFRYILYKRLKSL